MSERKALQRIAKKNRARARKFLIFDHPVMNADGVPDSVGDAVTVGQVRWDDFLPVRLGEAVVGTVQLWARGKVIFGTFRIKRKKLSGPIHGLVPAINGINEKTEGGTQVGLIITSIGLWGANADPRIPAFPTPQGDQ